MNPVDHTLYVIVDPSQAAGRSLAELARLAARGGATLIQLRDKESSTRQLVESARAIHAALAGTGVPLLINDRIDVALAASVEGVHIGQDDMSVADARRLLGPGAIIGLTIKSKAEAEAAPVELLDYVCVGGVFATTSKETRQAPIGVDGFAAIAQVFRARAPKLPVGAIAGITVETAPSLSAAGAAGVAVISAVTRAADPAQAAADLKRAVLSGRPALSKRFT
ncbi:MAG: thiamine phosphate synthase [Alphaproteobacteria bacterium]